MRFKERDLKPYAEPVPANNLTEGETYFSVQYLDEEMLIPVMDAWVFVGTNLSADDQKDLLYFQDAESYRRGVRLHSPEADKATFQSAHRNKLNHMFEYEQALDQLMWCSLRRTKAK